MSETKYLWDRRQTILLRAVTNRIYHQERQRIFEFRDGLVKAISILAGSVAFARVTDPAVIQWCTAVITVASAASLVFGFGTKARDSAKRASEWTSLERDIERAGERDFSESELAGFAARCNEVEAGEAAAHPGLLERCYVRACKSIGSTPSSPSSAWQLYRPVLVLH